MLRSAVIIYFSKKKSKTKSISIHAVKALPTPRGGNCQINYLHA